MTATPISAPYKRLPRRSAASVREITSHGLRNRGGLPDKPDDPLDRAWNGSQHGRIEDQPQLLGGFAERTAPDDDRFGPVLIDALAHRPGQGFDEKRRIGGERHWIALRTADARIEMGKTEIVRPLVKLEAKAPGSWYVNVLATFPEFRRQGLGRKLLQLADERARELGAKGLSVIVADWNERAARLYARTGYESAAREPVFPYPGCLHEGHWVLMMKDLRR